MPFPFDFERKGVLDFGSNPSYSSSFFPSSNPFLYKRNKKEGWFLGSEPTSVLDTIGSPSPPASTSTLSSSLGGSGGGGRGGGRGGCGSTDTAGVVAVSGNRSQKWHSEQQETSSFNGGVESGCGSSGFFQPIPPPLQIGNSTAAATSAAVAAEKCGLGMDDWESVLSESVAGSPSQEQSIIRWIMGDVEDPAMGLNKLLQSAGAAGGGGPADFEFNGGFNAVDPSYELDPVAQIDSGGGNLMGSGNPPNPMLSILSSNHAPPISSSPAVFNHQHQRHPPPESTDLKPQFFNPPLLINHHPQNPSFFLPFPYAQTDPNLIFPTPPPKRHNHGGVELNPPAQFSQGLSHPLQLLPHYQRPPVGMRPKIATGDEMGHHQAIIDQIFQAAELVQTGNSSLAEGILARLNHHISPIGKPFYRASFFCKEALQFLLNSNMAVTSPNPSPFSLILKIGAYKSFSEISPLLQFANFTCNQGLLEILEPFDRIHIVDFDIGYGGQWASLMHELSLRTGAPPPSLKITAFASPSTHDQFELGLITENLNQFAGEIKIPFEFQILSIDSLNSFSSSSSSSSSSWSLPLHISENDAVAVNLPVGSFSNYQLSLPIILRFVKQLSPKIVVSIDRGCDRTDLPFANHLIHTLQSYSNLLESLDAVNVNPDVLQKIERFLLQPEIEKIVTGRYRSSNPEKSQHWRNLFLSYGFSPLSFSNFNESQAECVAKRTPVRGFHVEKRQSSLVLCWQRKELVSASAWRC
ncbi:hypothetical protein U1Q18_036100 [Sarracenia purpurea var. burkii]